MLDLNGAVGVHGDGAHLTSLLAGAFPVDDGGIGTCLGTLAAVDALGLVDVCVLVLVQGDGVLGTDGLTVVGKAATTGVGDPVAIGGTFVAGAANGLHDALLLPVAAYCQLHPFGEDGHFLVGVVAGAGVIALGDLLWDVHHTGQQVILPSVTCDFTKHLIL